MKLRRGILGVSGFLRSVSATALGSYVADKIADLRVPLVCYLCEWLISQLHDARLIFGSKR